MAVEYPGSVKMQRNLTGHLIRLDGVAPLMLDWLSVRYNFDYSILDSNATSLEDLGPKQPGLISYTLRGECELILAVMLHSSERLKKLELVHPWMYAETAFLLPIPEILNNVNAVIKPFQPWTADKGLFKGFGDKLRANPKLRCNSSRQCVEMVNSLPRQHAYIDGFSALKGIIKEEYKRTGQCKTNIMKMGEASRPTGWALRKRSAYNEKFNRGMLVLLENGLISQWKKQFEADPRPCFDEDQLYRNAKNKEKPLARLSLANLTGAFAALAIGVFISVLAFLFELLVAAVTNKRITVI
ncbi:hypothetical protein GHT06_020026 [Daphnia sinensis]|uniref:Uncharacterized protein n=1 Tax=Daphnia sinensis TaxID=1820382 RepID=A0AAD5L3T8_9CRUS|nr:hypothetical protein GHT06_020026 [Daphnia sinensis]